MSDTEPVVTLERKPQSKVTLRVEVPTERVEAAAERAFRRLVQKVSIPGFRPGKAPRALYERSYGADHIYEEAARDLVDEIYRKALADEHLSPLDSPDVEIAQLAPKQPLRFEATVAVRPPVGLGDYKAHGQTFEPKVIADEEVDNVIADMREHHAALKPVQRAARLGDVLTVDVDATVDGRELPPLGRGAHLEVGAAAAIPGLSEGLVGIADGETKTLELPFPDDYPDPDLRTKPATFAVKAQQVAEKELPALDDDFAKTVGVPDLAALRETVRNELAHAAFHEQRDEVAEKVMAHAIDTATIDVPEILVEDELDHMVADLKDRLTREGLSYEEFLLRAKKSEADVRGEWRDAATRRAKSLLVLDEIAKREDVGVTSEELGAEVAAMAAATGDRDTDALRSPRVLAALARSLRNRKVIDKLVGIDSPDAEREMLRRSGAVVQSGEVLHSPAEEGTTA